MTRLVDITLRTLRGERLTWHLTEHGKGWWTDCPRCGKRTHVSREELTPAATRCWKCETWLPTP
jgi:hypothetical protein